MNNKRYSTRGRTVFTEEQVQERIKEALLLAANKQPSLKAMRERVFAELGIPSHTATSTPSRLQDNFKELLNQERADLCLGNLTDDQLANEVFLHGNPTPDDSIRRLHLGCFSAFAYLTAAKERIRWLSRQLDAALEILNPDPIKDITPMARETNNELQLLPGFFFYPKCSDGLEELTRDQRIELMTNQGYYGIQTIKNDPGSVQDFNVETLKELFKGHPEGLPQFDNALDDGRIPTHRRPGTAIPGYGSVPIDLREVMQLKG